MNNDAAISQSFFPTLLGEHAKREVKVSAAFSACFQHSTAFRVSVLELLCRLCSVPISSANREWSCRTEVHLPNGRIADLELIAAAYAKAAEPLCFLIENKVSAPLTEPQMDDYRRISAKRFIVALTKHPPETGLQWLRENGCYALRWQAVHRAVIGIRARGTDKFLCESFTHYLEELGMAHRADVREEDLNELHRLFRAMGSDKHSRMAMGTALEVAASCLGMADDVL